MSGAVPSFLPSALCLLPSHSYFSRRALFSLWCSFGVTWNVATHWPTRLSFSPIRLACCSTSMSTTQLNSVLAATSALMSSRALMR